MPESLYAQVPVHVHNEGVAVDLDGVDFETVEGDLVAGGSRGSLEGLAEQVGGIDLHAGGDLMAEEGAEEEVQLASVGYLVETGVAKANGLAFSVGGQGDLGGNRERQAQACASDGFSQAGVGLDADHDAVLVEGELGVLGIGEAGGIEVPFEVVAAVRAGEELLLQGALESVAADAHFHGAGSDGADQGEAAHQEKEAD